MNKAILPGFIILTMMLPLLVIPGLNDIYVYPKIALFSSLLAILIFLWAFSFKFSARVTIFSSPFFWPILVFFGANLLSLVKAVNVYEGLYHLFWLLSCIMVFFLVINNLNIRSMQRVIFWSIIGGVIVSAIGIGQFWGWKISFLPFRLGSTLGTKNMSAQHSILILPLTFIGFFFEKETKKELFYGLCGAVLAIFLIYTNSRGSWVAFAGAFAFMLILGLKSAHLRDFGRFLKLKRKKVVILASCLGLVALIGVAAPYIIPVPEFAEGADFLERFQSIFGIAHLSAQSRLAMAVNTVEMIKDHYPLGVGAGNWKFIYPLYSRSLVVDPIFTEKLQPNDAHNDWVQMAAEIGLGLIVFLWLILLAYKIGWKVLAHSLKGPFDSTRYRGLASFFLLFSISGMLINAFFDFPFKYPVSLFYFWMFLGFLQIVSSSNPSAPPVSQSKKLPTALPPLGEAPDESRKRILPRYLILILILVNFFIIAFAALNLYYLRGSYHFQQGQNLLKSGKIAEAITHVEKAVSLAPFEYRFYTLLGVLYSQDKQHEKMAIAARAALLYHPNYINAWNDLGVAYGKTGLFLDADKAFKKALHIYPDYFLAHLNLGNNYLHMGEVEKARREYWVALSINPDSQEVLYRLRALEKPR